MLLVLAIAPLVLGITRKVKARLLRRIGPPVWQPYLDLWKLMHKEAVLAHNASWLYRVAPYLVFAVTWVGAALVPTYATNLMFSWSADLIALVALLATGRFALALAGMDVGTAFGGIGSSREMMIASLAEPAMLLVVFTRGADRRHDAAFGHRRDLQRPASIGLRVSLGLALFAFCSLAIAENARIPIDNPATHLELTMVHEAMVLEYSGRHLAMIEAAAALKLVLYFSLLACLFVPFGMATTDKSLDRARDRAGAPISARSWCWRRCCRSARPRSPRCGCSAIRSSSAARSPRGALAVFLLFVSQELLMGTLAFDVAHLLAGGMLVLSFVLLYQDRITAMLNVFALQAIVLSLSVAWQAVIQDAPHLLVTAAHRAGRQGHRHPDRVAPDRATARHPPRDRGGDRRGTDHADGPRPRRAVDPAGAAGRRKGQHPGARGSGLRARGHPARPADDDHAAQRGDPDRRLHVAGERADARGDRRQGHAAGGRDSRWRSRS